MRFVIAFCGLVLATAGWAKLPDPTPEQQAAAQLNAAKAAHAAKADAYSLCAAQEKIAEAYIKEQKAKGSAYTPEATPACVNPGPFVAPTMTPAGNTPPAQAAAAPAAQSAAAAKPAAPAAKK
jgi:hypothetical protein